MLKTSMGLPNSCCACGKMITAKYWYAEHDDAARSGQGYHPKCDPDYVPPKPKTRRKKTVDKPN